MEEELSGWIWGIGFQELESNPSKARAFVSHSRSPRIGRGAPTGLTRLTGLITDLTWVGWVVGRLRCRGGFKGVAGGPQNRGDRP